MQSLLLSSWIHQIQAVFYTNLDTPKIGISFHFVGKKVLEFYPCFPPPKDLIPKNMRWEMSVLANLGSLAKSMQTQHKSSLKSWNLVAYKFKDFDLKL
jgi:hypothetical protein